MQTTSRKISETKLRKDKKEEPKRSQDEKLKKSVNTLSTPREYMQKTSASDIYTQKKSSVNKAPKKGHGVSSTSYVSPMKGLLRSSASSISQISTTSETAKKLVAKPISKKEAKPSVRSDTKPPLKKRELFTNVTVNSPIVKRKLDLNPERVKKEVHKVAPSKEVGSKKTKEVGEVRKYKEVENAEKSERHRTKTRTLDESEVKVLTLDKVDNNAEMLNLSKKLSAKPKAFYVEMDEKKPKELPNKEISDDEVSYEDDFESYESDFESYHSDAESNESEASGNRSEASGNDSEVSGNRSDASESRKRNEITSVENSSKERDEEKMLDSGNFDLRDQRSGRRKPTVMAFILEDTESDKKVHDLLEDDKKVSLDEGFQDMSTASVKVEERPLFIDFTKSKQNKMKRIVNERLKQRAKDLLGMITLHEMSYSLFEMQPISYDLYMATFGRSNYTQSGVQTFDDGITEEIQTDEVTTTQKWTQYPVKFSKNDIIQNGGKKGRKYSENTEDYLTKFTFLINEENDDRSNTVIKTDENYKENPLRILLEQKDGAGGDEMLPFETYKSKLKSEYNSGKLSKFLKKCASKVTRILIANTGDTLTNFENTSKLPFSKGHVTLSPKTLSEKYSFLNSSEITQAYFSDTKSNLIMTAHKNAQGVGKKSLICVWDLSVAREPIKILLVIDDVTVGRFRGNTDGIFVAALEDGSIHLWDLDEEPTWRDGVATEENSPEIQEIENDRLSQTEKDREWNLKNSKIGFQQSCIPFALHSCAFTTSGLNMNDDSHRIVGLEFMNNQIVSLQRIGIITIWNIVHDKSKTSQDIGKAFWSKIKLEKHQTINIIDHIDTTRESVNYNFNLNSAKRRIAIRKQEKHLKKEPAAARPSSSKFEFDIDRPYSAASLRKKVLPVEINLPKSWESGIVCNDLKIVNLNGANSFLVGKNCGEVLVCKRCLGVVRIERFSVATDTSSITSLDTSIDDIPYFLAATDTGTVNLCSLRDNRVLLILDCRNAPLTHSVLDKCRADHKGRFLDSVAKCIANDGNVNRLEIKSVHWSGTNHCCVYALLKNGTLISFDLTHSDINAKSASVHAAVQCTHSVHTLALVTPEGEVQIHRLTDEMRTKEFLHLFNKYVALL